MQREQLLKACHWPPLRPPYDGSLREAVRFVLAEFEVLGILACGTIVLGEADASSDLDVYVINSEQRRQRIQRLFAGVPTEIFVNPPSQVRQYFEDERRDGRPRTAHMLATGYVVLERDGVIGDLRREARRIIESSPDPDERRLTALRYGAATRYEDAVDVADDDPATADMILAGAVRDMLQYAFHAANRWLPRDKDLLDALSDLDPPLAELARAFHQDGPISRRLMLAEKIAARTIKVGGFFEWESERERC